MNSYNMVEKVFNNSHAEVGLAVHVGTIQRLYYLLTPTDYTDVRRSIIDKFSEI